MSRVENKAECTAIHTCIRIAKPRAVKDIEHVSPELGCHSLGNARIFYNAKVLTTVTWAAGARQKTGRITKTKRKGVDA